MPALPRFVRRGSHPGAGRSIDDCGAFAVRIEANVRIVMAGESPRLPGRSNELALARLRPRGTLDTSFGDRGRVAIGFNNGDRQDWASGLAIEADGKLVAAGMSHQPMGQEFAVARFNTGG